MRDKKYKDRGQQNGNQWNFYFQKRTRDSQPMFSGQGRQAIIKVKKKWILCTVFYIYVHHRTYDDPAWLKKILL